MVKMTLKINIENFTIVYLRFYQSINRVFLVKTFRILTKLFKMLKLIKYHISTYL